MQHQMHIMRHKHTRLIFWYPDSGATCHITPDLSNLSIHTDYGGNDMVKVGNGTGLPIQHIGHSTLNTYSSPLQLHDVLLVPSITKNFQSINRLTKDNNVFFEFHPHRFSIKDRASRRILLQGPASNGLYHLQPGTLGVENKIGASWRKGVYSAMAQSFGSSGFSHCSHGAK